MAGSWSWTYQNSEYTSKTLTLSITETVNESSNSSTLTWTFTSSGSRMTVAPTTIKINGVQVHYNNLSRKANGGGFPYENGSVSGTIVISHNADGTKTGVNVFWSTGTYDWEPSTRVNESINLTSIATYTLSVSAGSGSSISVNRTASGYAGTGIITSGTRLYKNDVLKISFSPNTGYILTSTTVNENPFSSGNSYTVSGNVSVASTAQQGASAISAADADIESASTIVVTRYSSSNYHSIYFSFNGISGYITPSGTISATEVKYQETVVSFTIPSSFYEQMPNDQSGTCDLTCRTYASSSSSTLVGDPSTTSFVVRASASRCTPTVSLVVTDVNPHTVELTDDAEQTLVRYKSTARATITAEVKNFATIVSVSVNGVQVDLEDMYLDFENTTTQQYTATVTDSRGFSASASFSMLRMIPYSPLTINPTVSRPAPTSDKLTISLSGDMFVGDWRDTVPNTLYIRYRYAELGSSQYSDEYVIDNSKITFTSSGYYTASPVELVGEFDYQTAYTILITAYDGNPGRSVILTQIEKTITQQKGIPVFDWGANDFRFNVPVYGTDADFSGGTVSADTITGATASFSGNISAAGLMLSGLSVLPVVESSVGAASGYIKYANGLTLAWKQFERDNYPITKAWGSLYENTNDDLTFGDMPNKDTNAEFSSAPAVFASPSGNNSAIIASIVGVTATSWGRAWVVRGVQLANTEVKVNLLAIGFSAV